MGRVKLLPWRYTMFGFGNRNTSYAFFAGAIFLVAAGEQYHTFAAICAAIALLMAYLKINDLEKEMERNWVNRDLDDRSRDMGHEFAEVRREIMNIHDKLCDRNHK